MDMREAGVKNNNKDVEGEQIILKRHTTTKIEYSNSF